MTQAEDTCSTLQQIAATFPDGSAENQAIRRAAEAVLFLAANQRLDAAFRKFQNACHRELNEDQLAVLRGYGIDPDAP